jgi:tRNA A-37 threonylcarbamoyl transferase component Bud32
MNIIKSLNKLSNDNNSENYIIKRLSNVKFFNITYRVKCNNDTYIVRECEEQDHYDFLKSVNIEMENYNICPPSLLYDDENKIIVSKYIEQKPFKYIDKNSIIELLNKITILQSINIPDNTIITKVKSNEEWLSDDNYKLHKKWYNLYKAINKKLKEELGICLNHNDLHPRNIVFNNSELYIIDFEFITYDHKFRDIGTILLFIDKHELYNHYKNLTVKEKILLDISFIENLLYYSKTIKELCEYNETIIIDYNSIKLFDKFIETIHLNPLQPKDNYILTLMCGKTAEQKIKELYSSYPEHIDYINSFFTFE